MTKSERSTTRRLVRSISTVACGLLVSVFAREMGCVGCTGGDWTPGELPGNALSALRSTVKDLSNHQDRFFSEGAYRFATLEELEARGFSGQFGGWSVELELTLAPDDGEAWAARAWVVTYEDEPCGAWLGSGQVTDLPGVALWPEDLVQAMVAAPGGVQCPANDSGRSPAETAQNLGLLGMAAGWLMALAGLVGTARVGWARIRS